jgi:hypothetical protein
MNSEIIKLLGSLEVLTDPKLLFYLRNNESGNWKTFLWDRSECGAEFNTLDLAISNGWATWTDVEIVIQEWLELEQRRYLNLDDDREEYEDRGCFDDPEPVDRQGIYAELIDLLNRDFTDAIGLKFSRNPDYTFYVILAKSTEENWICLCPTAPKETPIESERDYLSIDCSPIEPIFIDYSNSMSKIRELLDSIEPIKIYGYYGGGYDYHFDNYLVYAVANSQASALEIALQKSGMLKFYKFHKFNSTRTSEYYSHELDIVHARYDRLNNFLECNFPVLTLMDLTFWDAKEIYIYARTIDDLCLGIQTDTNFHYNP